MQHEADLKVAKLLIDGHESQFDLFFEDYFPRLYRFATSRLENDIDSINDIVQTTLINAMKAMASYRGDASMFTWLCQICRNEINAHFRRLSRSVPVVAQDDDAIRPILESIEADEMDSPDVNYEGLELKRLVQEVMDFLPTKYGNALEWKYIEGFSVTEIAEKLNLTELATQSLLARARVSFRNTIAQISPQLSQQR